MPFVAFCTRRGGKVKFERASPPSPSKEEKQRNAISARQGRLETTLPLISILRKISTRFNTGFLPSLYFPVNLGQILKNVSFHLSHFSERSDIFQNNALLSVAFQGGNIELKLLRPRPRSFLESGLDTKPRFPPPLFILWGEVRKTLSILWGGGKTSLWGGYRPDLDPLSLQ